MWTHSCLDTPVMQHSTQSASLYYSAFLILEARKSSQIQDLFDLPQQEQMPLDPNLLISPPGAAPVASTNLPINHLWWWSLFWFGLIFFAKTVYLCPWFLVCFFLAWVTTDLFDLWTWVSPAQISTLSLKSGVWFGYTMSPTDMFEPLLPSWWCCLGRLWNLLEMKWLVKRPLGGRPWGL